MQQKNNAKLDPGEETRISEPIQQMFCVLQLVCAYLRAACVGLTLCYLKRRRARNAMLQMLFCVFVVLGQCSWPRWCFWFENCHDRRRHPLMKMKPQAAACRQNQIWFVCFNVIDGRFIQSPFMCCLPFSKCFVRALHQTDTSDKSKIRRTQLKALALDM